MNVINGDLILESSVEYCRMITDKLLAETNLTLDDIDFFITSDQSTKYGGTSKRIGNSL